MGVGGPVVGWGGWPHLEGLVGAEHRCDLVPAVGAPHSAELAYQPLACLAVVGYLFLVVWAHQALGTERAMASSAMGHDPPMACGPVRTRQGEVGALPALAG